MIAGLGAEESVTRLVEAKARDEQEAERIKAEIVESLRSIDRIVERARRREKTVYRPDRVSSDSQGRRIVSETIERMLEEAIEAPDGRSAEETLNRLIETRAEDTQARERVDREIAEEMQRTDLNAKRARRREWAEHFRKLATVHEQLAEQNRERLARLIDEGA